ncbi:glycosyltransferase [Paenarthrobacter nicotinovorans]|uniref:Glycosyltransferase n=1 Tax=Paenarthrobacter nicotinovorans TaxID=29320 RepID=A0ABV0GU18_PAENI
MLRKLFDRPAAPQTIWTNHEPAQPRSSLLIDSGKAPTEHVMLRKKAYEVRFQVVPGSEVTATFQTISDPSQHETKAGIIWVKFIDKHGNEVPSRGRISKGPQGYYVYIVPDALSAGEAKLYIPEDCTEVVLGFALWKGYPGSLSLGNRVSVQHSVLPLFPESANRDADNLRGHRIVLSSNHEPSSAIDLQAEPLWINVSVLEVKHFRVQAQLPGGKKCRLGDAVLLFRFSDKNGDEVGSLTDIPRGLNGEYVYIQPDADGQFSFEVHAPADCVSVRMGIAAWKAKPGSLQILNALEFNELTAESANELRPGFGPPQSKSAALQFDRLHELGARVPVTERARWARIPITHIKGPQLRVKFEVEPKVAGLTPKSGLTLIEFADIDGGRIPVAELATSEEHGEFKYIDGRQRHDVSLTLNIPKNATEIRVGTMLWAAVPDQLFTSNQIWVEGLEDKKPERAKAGAGSKPASFATTGQSVVALDQPRRAKDLKVALIADEFTYNCFKYEFTPIIFEPQNWRERFESNRPDLFLCESAWSGTDSVTRPWKGRIYASSNFARENRTELLEILAWCNQEKIPTVFWNKEDPTHFDDKIHNFIDTAILFDHVFTTDLTCVPRYEEQYDHPSVHCLPFATQPKLFNPRELAPRAKGVSFAGSWYANHAERSTEMTVIFEQILEAGLDLRIFDRFWGTDDELHLFPEQYRHLTEPAIPHSEIANAYKSTTLGLNINTVTSSPTMFARRIFELMSCNTLVVSNYSPGVAEFFDGRILFAGENHNDILELEPEQADSIRHAALHDVLANHTYQRRFEQILDSIGFDYAKPSQLVTLVCPVENEHELVQAIARQAEFADIANGLVIVLGQQFQKSDAAYYQAKYGRFGVIVLSWAWAADEVLDAATYVRGEAFALVLPDSSVTATMISEASLHLCYADGPIAIGDDDPYRFSAQHSVRDIVARPAFFQKAVKHYGQTISDNFYLV